MNQKQDSQFLTVWIFLRFLGVIYLIAFASLGVQVQGLLGSQGILPAGGFLKAVFAQIGPEGYWLVPTLAWFNSSDFFLQFLCWGGVVFALLVILDLAPPLVLFLCWLFYLSLVNIGQDFLSFQWDILLLEVGFLAVFLTPVHWLPKFPLLRVEPPSMMIWLLRFLLFKLMFLSGFVKLASGDPAWANLTALNFHYETQPIPNFVSYFAHHLSPVIQTISTFMTLVIELVIPFFIFTPRLIRFTAGGVLILFQLLIILTGNYCFFNLLTLLLCLLLFDDSIWPRVLKTKIEDQAKENFSIGKKSGNCSHVVLIPFFCLMVFLSVFSMTRTMGLRGLWPKPFLTLAGIFQPFHLANGYGLFAVMTTSRPEIIIEGSENGKDWKAYEFKWKAGDVKRMPVFVAPHQPRLDWQMWFAALGPYQQNPWFINLMIRIMQGSPEVLALFAVNPFPEAPPTYLRAEVYDYQFSDFSILKDKGVWWNRVRKRSYCPVLKREGKQIAFEK